jgi:hypothetical protein
MLTDDILEAAINYNGKNKFLKQSNFSRNSLKKGLILFINIEYYILGNKRVCQKG